MNKVIFCLLPVMTALAGCASSQAGSNLPRGSMAYGVIPMPSESRVAEDYRIGPLDAIDVTVLQEPDLSAKAVAVDAHGNVNLPLIGDVTAAGKTPGALSREIAARYGERYLRNPQVSVIVSKPVAQKVVVQGEVAQPGVYTIEGPTTLLGALALAKGETQIASLNEVVVFRTINGKRMGAVFDVKSIRSGQSEDPEIRSNDLIVVGYSSAKRFWRDVVSSMPILNVFRPF
jgi:polysaccharide export outer membrane protein